MTRFVSEAIGHRSSKSGVGGGGDKARRQELEHFLKTGVHPSSQAAAAAAAEGPLPLPAPVDTRPHVFLDFAHGSRPLGRAVVEVFDDTVPLAAAQLLRRCSRGAADPLAGAAAARLVRARDLTFPPPSSSAAASSSATAAAASSTTLDTNAAARRTRFSSAGVVGVSRDGLGGLALALGNAPGLEATHLVVGRVRAWVVPAAAAAAAADGGTTKWSLPATAFAESLNAVRTDPATDAPLGRLTVARAGLSDASGAAATSADEAAAAQGGGGGGAAAADPRLAAKAVRATTNDALKEGLGRKKAGGAAGAAGGGAGDGNNKAPATTSAAGAAAAPAAARAAAPPAAKRRRTMLNALSGSEDEDDTD
jgi:hypothetical protein